MDFCFIFILFIVIDFYEKVSNSIKIYSCICVNVCMFVNVDFKDDWIRFGEKELMSIIVIRFKEILKCNYYLLIFIKSL